MHHVYDYFGLQIFEGGAYDYGKLIGRYCGNSLPPPIKSETETVTVKFTTDNSRNDEGFQLNYQMICGGVFRAESGNISSPNYPNFYSHESNCEYDIIAPEGKAIKLDILDFDIEARVNCLNDYLEIVDFAITGNETKSNRYCGTKKPEKSFISLLNHLQILFVSDDSVHGRGFAANYSFIYIGCGSIVTNETTLSLPTGQRRVNNDCRWVVIAPRDRVIRLNCRNFQLDEPVGGDCQKGVTIFESNLNSSSAGPFCGTQQPGVITTTGNIAIVHFDSIWDGTPKRLWIDIEFVDGSKLCSANYFSVQGVLRSPSKPGMLEYLDNKQCEWTITVPHGQQIEINFKYFHLENSAGCDLDFLEIRNGISR